MLSRIVNAIMPTPHPSLSELRIKLARGKADFEALRKTRQEAAADAADLRYKRRCGENVSDDEIRRLEAASEEAARELKICEVVNEDLETEIKEASAREDEREFAELKAAKKARVESAKTARLKASRAVLEMTEALLELTGNVDIISGEHLRRGVKFDVEGFVAGLGRALHLGIDAAFLAEAVPARFGPDAMRKYKNLRNGWGAEERRLAELAALLNPPAPVERIDFNGSGPLHKIKCPNPACGIREAFLSHDRKHAQCFSCRLTFPTPQTYLDEAEQNAARRALPPGQHKVEPNLNANGKPLETGRPKNVPEPVVFSAPQA